MRDNSGIAARRITRRMSAAFSAAVTCARTPSRSACGYVPPSASGSSRWPVPASRLTILCALGCAMAISGCAPESRPGPISAAAASPSGSESKTCHPDRALLVPQPAPDCGFGRADLKTLDPDQWARLKLEYELTCYKEAEKIARHRLRLLQAATRCEATPAR
jgi:hypothetical protein